MRAITIPKFSKTGTSFHGELKKRIKQYFKETGKRSTGNAALFAKAIILVCSFLFIYVHLVFFTPIALLAILECLVLGVLASAIGFNIMHDGMHGSFSRFKWVNKLAGSTLNFLGANNFLWKMKHNIIHHTYTNINGVDDDIEARPFLRLCESQKYYKMHRFQHWYFWIAYSLLYLFWVFFSDFKKYFRRRIGPTPLTNMTWQDHMTFWVYKCVYAFLFLVLPIEMVGFTTWITGFLIFSLFAGFVLSIVFQLAHTVEHTEFPLPDVQTGKMEDEWVLHQLKTTANFATRNKFISWWMGGLNFQIEHHLFPRISHIHYPAISKIIKKACEDFGMPYIEYRQMRRAVVSHVNYLKSLSRKPAGNLQLAMSNPSH
jgi:linoleoyl-CoA desaturase